MNLDITVNMGKVEANLEEMIPRVQTALSVVGNTVANKMESYAQNNARWTDRTSAARTGLKGDSKWQGTTLDISIMHSVDYGIWLELRDFPHAGRLAILTDARDSQVETFINMIKKILG